MCGRFVEFSPLSRLISEFALNEAESTRPQPSYNIAPSQPVLAVVRGAKCNELRNFRWGLVPSWARDPKIGYKMINACAVTLSDKPSFRSAYAKRRCLIVCDGFYEWKREGSNKTPYFFYLNSRRPFGLGGLYERWVSPQGEILDSCTIITTAPNSLMEPIHNRMPLILPKASEDMWLDPEIQDTNTLNSLLGSYPAEDMDAYAVSPQVNSPSHNSPENILKVV